MMTGADIEALKAYVRAPDGGMQNRDAATVLLHVSHSNLAARFMEIRLDLHMTVDAVKTKLMLHCGTSPSSMRLQLKDDRGQLLAELDPARPLGFYSPHDGFVLHIIDTDPLSLSANGWLEDVTKVQKYEMSDEAYSQRENTYRKFREQKLKEDPSWTLEKEMAARRGLPHAEPKQKVDDPEYQQQQATGISVGNRCEVQPGAKRGTVRFVGKVPELPLGYWVGVEYDEPVGKNDGSVKGRQYFQAVPGFGGFARPANVAVGDYPPLDIEFDEDDEI